MKDLKYVSLDYARAKNLASTHELMCRIDFEEGARWALNECFKIAISYTALNQEVSLDIAREIKDLIEGSR